MARKEIIVDDIDGTELQEGQGETIVFSVSGIYYQLDLGQKSLDKFHKALQPFVDKAETLKPERSPLAGPRRAVDQALKLHKAKLKAEKNGGMSKEQRDAIRDWANNNGYTVGDRGRIKGEIIEAFEAAHKK